jgi:hypothetical protein
MDWNYWNGGKMSKPPRTALVLVLRLGKRARRSVAFVGAAPAGLVPLCSRGIVRANPFFRLCAGGETRRWGHGQKRGLPRSKHSG